MWLLVLSILLAALVAYVVSVLFWGSSSDEGFSIDDFISADSVGPASHPLAVDADLALPKGSGMLVLVLYGTEYGFSEEVAEALGTRLAGEGYRPRVLNSKDFGRVSWGREQALLGVFSTSGDGVPPSEAWPFMQFVSGAEAAGMSHLHYSVLALGDSNYPHFCSCGRTLDSRLAKVGAHCMVAQVDIDQEDWLAIRQWEEELVRALWQLKLASSDDYLSPADGTEETGFSRTRPFMATLCAKQLLTEVQTEGDKETIHSEFDLSGSQLEYSPGDALGVYPTNNPPEVEVLLAALHCRGEEEVQPPRSCHQHLQPCTQLRDALLYCYDLKVVRAELVQAVVQSAVEEGDRERGQQLLENGLSKENKQLINYLGSHEVIDVFNDFKSHTMAYMSVLANLKILQSRYYSIASAPTDAGDRVAICAAVIRYQLAGREGTGVATTFLQDRLPIGVQCPVFISSNPDFRLPPGDLPIIMIGPGTGIAPFRAFVQERARTMAVGENLLYFGCRHCHKDFLYKEELRQWEQNGLLHLRVAFSRDQKEKVYVQQLIVEDKERVWALLEKRAHIYVCGDARAMASDVHQALQEVVQSQLDCPRQQAVEFLHNLEQQNRYQKDVWIT